jgi:folate-binding Fe-S cluster repair protein YgfZ
MNQGTLKISGPDAKTLLQGQLTYDVEKITPTHSSLSAFCNPQGRVISLFTLSIIENDYYLTMPADLIPITINKLQKYAIFYKVTLTDITDTLPPTPNKQNNITAGIPAIYPATSEKKIIYIMPKLLLVTYRN